MASETTQAPVTIQYSTTNNNNVNWKNQLQSKSLSAGALIFISAGMNLALGLGWNFATGVPSTLHLQFCWFIAVSVGALVSAPLITLIPNKYYMLTSGFLVTAGGIIFTSAPYNYSAILAARYINGFGMGFAVVPFLIHSSEIAGRRYRGSHLSIEQYALSIGIAIQVIYSSQWTYDIDFAPNRVHGIFSIVFGLCAMVFSLVVTESPIFYIRKNNEVQALECLRVLQYPQEINDAKKQVLQDMKGYVIENENYTFIELLSISLGPLLKLIFFRGIVAFSFSLPLNGALQVASFVSMGYSNSWPPIVFSILRFFGAFLSLWILDGLGRKLLSLFGLLVMAGLTLGIGIIFSNGNNIIDDYQMSIICTLSLLSQFFAGLFVPCTSVYLGEAFPLVIKPYFIALCIIIEQVIHIVVICTYFFNSYNLYIYCLTVSIIMFVLFLIFVTVIPETRSSNLREAQNRFRKMWYLPCY